MCFYSQYMFLVGGLSLSSFRDISSAEEDEVEKDGLSFSIGGYMTQCNKVEQ